MFAVACSQDSAVEIQANEVTTEATTETTTETTTEATVEATTEVTARVLTIGVPSGLLSEVSTDLLLEEIFLHKLYVGLSRVNRTGQLEPEMIVALPSRENEGISSDGLTYTFLLNKDLKWSDEGTVSAQQILETLISYDSVKEQNVEWLEVFNKLDLTQSMAIDDRTLVLKLREPSSEFLTLTSRLPFLPIRSGETDEKIYFISNGPFQLDSWSSNRVSLIPNELWKDQIGDIWTQEIDRLEFVAFESFSAAKEAFVNQEIDVLNLTVFQASDDFVIPGESEIYAKPRHITYGVFVNSQPAPFSAVESRQALALGLNKEKLLNLLPTEIQRGYTHTNSWIPPGIFGSDNSAGLLLSTSEELATDYWARGLNNEDINIELLYSSDDSLHVELATELEQLWERRLPVRVNLRPEKAEEYFADLKAGRYQLAIGGWRGDYPDASNWLRPFVSDSEDNFLNFADEKYDAFLQAAEVARDENEKFSKYAEAHKYLIEQSVIIPMLHPVSLALVRSEFRAAVNAMFDFQGAWTFD